MLQRALIMLLLCGAMHALQLTLQRSSISSQRLLKRKTLLRMGIEDNYSRIPFNELLEGVQSIPSVSNTRHTPQLLRNRYVGLRHGQSKANVQGIISSNPAIGTVEHNLTDMGIQQANEAALDLLEDLKESNDSTDPFNNVVVISSDFTRAKEAFDGRSELRFVGTKPYISQVLLIRIIFPPALSIIGIGPRQRNEIELIIAALLH